MLPYRQFGAVTSAKAAAGVLGTCKVSIWPSPEPRETATGDVWDFTGEAEIEAAELLVGKTNRRLFVVDSAAELPDIGSEDEPAGVRFAVLAAVRHDFLPHLELRLQEVRGG